MRSDPTIDLAVTIFDRAIRRLPDDLATDADVVAALAMACAAAADAIHYGATTA